MSKVITIPSKECIVKLSTSQSQIQYPVGYQTRKLCSKCADNEPAPGHRWCKNCKAQHQRENREMLQSRLFRRGLEAMRQAAIEKFQGIGNGGMTGYTAMYVMRDLKLSE
jgi:hypothetical protein